MGTLGCINDMLRRDKENRELRKRSRERMAETRKRIMEVGKETDYPQMTLEKMEDIRRKTLEKEQLDKTSFYKMLLYYGIGATVILLVIWLLVGCSSTPNIKQQTESGTSDIGSTTPATAVVVTDTIGIKPLVTHTKHVADTVFTPKQLQAIYKELNRKISQAKNKQVSENIYAWGIYDNRIHIQVGLKSPEMKELFRKEIMDSPAICLEGPEELVPDNRIFTSDTLGISLQPEFSAYPDTAYTATFILQNHSRRTICCGDKYHITFQDSKGTWRTLPTQFIFNSIEYIIEPEQFHLVKAQLNPHLLPNKPGKYRFFYEISTKDTGKQWMLMAEFLLTDKKQVLKEATQVQLPKGDASNVVDIEYIPSEDRPMPPG